MADDVELRLLGEGMKRPQADVRDVKARVLLLESDQSDLRQDLQRMERKIKILHERMDDRFQHVDDRFERMMDAMTSNFRLLFTEIEAIKRRLPEAP